MILEGIAKKICFGSRAHGRRSLDVNDLIAEGFIKMIEILPDKPPKIGIREFTEKPINKALSTMNRELFKEVTFGEEVYLDIFSTDEEVWG